MGLLRRWFSGWGLLEMLVLKSSRELHLQTVMMVSKKVVASLLLVYVVSMLAEQTEGFVPFFTQSDFRKMQLPPQLAVPVRAGMCLTPRQLEKYQDVLEKLLAEMLQDTPDGCKVCKEPPSPANILRTQILILLKAVAKLQPARWVSVQQLELGSDERDEEKVCVWRWQVAGKDTSFSS
ncbi:promotilin isoform x2 [Limosa lapponica baueri]|uniref:Promotilin isoform x2 n=1 Tax=Limosa lapponica baueri TaxID=1758121 RepID=A0A2I0THJ8_LIMLA|nr:promotilin isoform x2 [Limosa lapponica baueri]